MTKVVKNIGASVRERLLNLSKARGEDFQLLLTRYANERLLYRLSVSSHAKSFVLKGATLFSLWLDRSTSRAKFLLRLFARRLSAGRRRCRSVCQSGCCQRSPTAARRGRSGKLSYESLPLALRVTFLPSQPRSPTSSRRL